MRKRRAKFITQGMMSTLTDFMISSGYTRFISHPHQVRHLIGPVDHSPRHPMNETKFPDSYYLLPIRSGGGDLCYRLNSVHPNVRVSWTAVCLTSFFLVIPEIDICLLWVD